MLFIEAREKPIKLAVRTPNEPINRAVHFKNELTHSTAPNVPVVLNICATRPNCKFYSARSVCTP